MARYTPASVGESEQWSSIDSKVEENRQNFCKALTGKTLLSALYCMYIVALHKLKAVLKANTPAGQFKTPKSAATQDGFKEVRKRKWHSTNETTPTSKKGVPIAMSAAIDTLPQGGRHPEFLRPTPSM
jgi:hypothetical protein